MLGKICLRRIYGFTFENFLDIVNDRAFLLQKCVSEENDMERKGNT